MTQGFTIARTISHERLDDEVIAIDLQTGIYYALDDVAADCWSVAVAGGGIAAMVTTVVQRYGIDIDDASAIATVESDITAFVQSLVDAGLLSQAGNAVAVSLDLDVVTPATAYVAPSLATYDDLETLLLIDPIHEVDEAGWPMQPGAPEVG